MLARRRLRRAADAAIGGWSQVSNEPVLDLRTFPEGAALRRDWRAIRDETAAARIVLVVRSARPLRQPGRWLAKRLVRAR